MTEYPVIFSAPMVRAILEGRKTVTRRLPTPVWDAAYRWASDRLAHAGDLRLWVRETWVAGWPASDGELHDTDEDGNQVPQTIWYRADNDLQSWLNDETGWMDKPVPWRPSIHMPRWASRITLDVVSMRKERLQDIGEEDAAAEGCGGHVHRAQFRALWNSLHRKPGTTWNDDPEVYRIEFRRAS